MANDPFSDAPHRVVAYRHAQGDDDLSRIVETAEWYLQPHEAVSLGGIGEGYSGSLAERLEEEPIRISRDETGSELDAVMVKWDDYRRMCEFILGAGQERFTVPDESQFMSGRELFALFAHRGEPCFDASHVVEEPLRVTGLSDLLQGRIAGL